MKLFLGLFLFFWRKFHDIIYMFHPFLKGCVSHRHSNCLDPIWDANMRYAGKNIYKILMKQNLRLGGTHDLHCKKVSVKFWDKTSIPMFEVGVDTHFGVIWCCLFISCRWYVAFRISNNFLGDVGFPVSRFLWCELFMNFPPTFIPSFPFDWLINWKEIFLKNRILLITLQEFI